MKKLIFLLSIFMITALLCACEGGGHTHSYATTMEASDTHHWFACNGCEEKKDYAPHDFTNGNCICGAKKPQAELFRFEWISERNAYALAEMTDPSFSGALTIPATYNGAPVVKIQNNAFAANASGITSLTVPDSITYIGLNAFGGCQNLESISLPFVGRSPEDTNENLTHFTYVFGAQQIGSVNGKLPQSLTSVTVRGGKIQSRCFSGCTNIVSIYLPNDIKTISEAAFGGCYSLKNIAIPESVLSIGAEAFQNCDALESITLGAQIRMIGARAFYSCASLAEVSFGDGIEQIGVYAFAECESLRSVALGTKLNSITASVFRGCALESISVSEANEAYHSIGNCLIETTSGTLVLGCKNSALPMDGSLRIIGESAFYGVSDLGARILPEGITTIEEHAFCDAGLTAITLPNSLLTVGDSAFSGCAALNTLAIGNQLTEIGDFAFRDCESLTSVTLPSSLTTLGKSAFSRCKALTSIVLSENLTVIPENALEQTALTALILPEGITHIEKHAIAQCKSLAEISLPSTLVCIGELSFAGCTALLALEIPQAVAEIGNQAFFQCSALESITAASANAAYVAEGNCLIEKETNTLILGCKNSTIPAGVLTIKGYAFFGCEGPQIIAIPTGVTEIEEYAFVGLAGVDSVLIPNTVISMDVNSFANFTDSYNVFYKLNETMWKTIHGGTAPYRQNEQVYFYSESYKNGGWHYAEDGVTPKKW